MNPKEQLNHSITSQKIQRQSSTYNPQSYVRKYYPESQIYGPTKEYQIGQGSSTQQNYQPISTKFSKQSQPKVTTTFQNQNQNYSHMTGSVREMKRSIPFGFGNNTQSRQPQSKIINKSITAQTSKQLKSNINWEIEALKWKEKYEDLEKRMEILKKGRNQTQVEYELSNQLDRKTQEIVELKKEIEDLKQQVTFKSFDESILFSNDVQKLKGRIKELMIELQKKPKLIKVEKIEKYNEKYEPADMARIIDEEKNKNKNLEKQVQTMRRDIQDKDNIIRQNKIKIDDLEKRAPNNYELDSLKSQLKDNQNKLNDKIKQMGMEKSNNFQLTKEIGTLKNQLENLKRKNLQDQSNQSYELRNKDQQLNDLKNQLKLKDLEMDQLKNRQQQKPNRYQIDNNFSSTLDNIKKEQDKLLQDKNNTIEDLKAQIYQQQQKLRDLQNNNDYNESKINRLEKEMKNQPQPQRFDSDNLEKRIHSLQLQNKDAQDEIDRLKKKNNEFDNDNYDLQKQIKDLKNQLINQSPGNERKLRDEIKDKEHNEQKLVKEIQILKDELRQKNDYNITNDDDRNHLKDQLRKERQNNDDLHDQLDQLKRKNKNKIRGLEDEIEELQNQMKKNKFTDEFKAQLLSSINPQQGYHKEHIKEIIEKSSNNNNKDLEGTLKDIFYAIKEINLRKDSDNKPFLQDLNQTRYKDEDVLDMKIELKDLKTQNDQLKDKLDKASGKGQRLKDELKDLKEKNYQLEKQVNVQNNQIKETKEYREVLVPERKETKDDNSELIPKLQNQIQQLKQENEKLRGLEEDWRKMLRKKKKALLNELSNFVNSKNNFENSFYNELTKPTPAN